MKLEMYLSQAYTLRKLLNSMYYTEAVDNITQGRHESPLGIIQWDGVNVIIEVPAKPTDKIIPVDYGDAK